MLLGESVIFDTEGGPRRRTETDPTWETIAAKLTWTSYREPMPGDRADAGTAATDPVEQLLLTRDETDYCWYSTRFVANSASDSEIVIPYGGDFFYVFVDGQPVAQSEAPFRENRGFIVAESAEHPRIVANPHDEEHLDGFRHRFSLGRLSAGEHRLDLLSVALGMIKGDWQIGYPMNLERKGIWAGVLLDGAPLRGWQMRPRLATEILGLPDVSKLHWLSPAEHNFAVQAHSAERARSPSPLTWYKSEFSMDAAALANEADYRIDAKGMGKGSLFLNGNAVGRYWLINAESSELPSQRYYHVPRTWLSPRNTLLLFEEQVYRPEQLTLERRVAKGKSNSRGKSEASPGFASYAVELGAVRDIKED
jgi:hypothetical protein